MTASSDVAGVYRPTGELLRTRRWRLWILVVAVLWFAAHAVLALAHHRSGAAAYYLGVPVAGSLLLWFAWTQRTVVGPEGIRTKRGLRWRTIAWDEVGSVPEPGRWSVTTVLSVTTTSGQQVPLSVPDALWQPFVAYAEEHRQGRPERPGVPEG